MTQSLIENLFYFIFIFILFVIESTNSNNNRVLLAVHIIVQLLLFCVNLISWCIYREIILQIITPILRKLE